MACDIGFVLSGSALKREEEKAEGRMQQNSKTFFNFSLLPTTMHSLENYRSTALPNRATTAPISSYFTSTAVYSLLSDGYITCAWTKTGATATSFGDRGFLSTTTKYPTCLLGHTTTSGVSRLLVGGGFDVGDVQQGVVQLYESESSKCMATFMGGVGLVRCLGIPGTDAGSFSTVPPSPESDSDDDEPRLSSALVEPSQTNEDDLYADDPTFRPNADDVADEQEKLRKKLSKAAKTYQPNTSRFDSFVTAGDDTIVRVYDVQSKSLSHELSDSALGAVKAIATTASRRGLIVTAHRAHEGPHAPVALWDINGKTLLGTLDAHVSEVTCAVLSPDGNIIYTAGGADDPTIKEFDIRMMRKIKNVSVHEGHVTSLSLVSTSHGNHILSSSKDGAVNLTAVKKSGVVKSKIVAEISDHDGWITNVSLSPMRPATYAGGQAKAGKPDIFTVGTDRYLRQYDLSDFIDLSDKEKEVAGGVERLVLEEKLDAAGAYHKQQLEFWDNLGPDAVDTGHNKSIANQRKKESASAAATPSAQVDRWGNEFGSIDYWVAKGASPKRPRVGDLVVLAGDNGDDFWDPHKEVKLMMKTVLEQERTARADKLPEEAKSAALRFAQSDLGIVTKDDNSGVPFQVFSGLTGETAWYEQDWVEVATDDRIKESLRSRGITRDDLKRRKSVKKAAKQEDEDEETEDGDDAEAMEYYNMMMGRGVGPSGGEDKGSSSSPVPEAKESAAEPKLESKSEAADDDDDISLSEFKPPRPPATRKSQEEIAADEERQRLVQESMSIYRSKKKPRERGKGSRF